MKSYHTEEDCFLLKDPETGKPWENLLWNRRHFILSLTHTGGSFCRFLDEDADQIVLNTPGRNFVYVRDDESGVFFNPGVAPACAEAEHYFCEHGMNHSEVGCEVGGIAAAQAFAVAEEELFGIWRVQVENRSKRPRKLSVFAALSFCLEGFPQPAYYNAGTTTVTRFSSKTGAIVCENFNPYAAKFSRPSGFLLPSEPPASFEGNWEKFLGTLGSAANPREVREGRLSCSEATVRERGGVLQHVLTLAPGESRTLWYLMGFIKDLAELEASAASFLKIAEQTFEGIREKGRTRFGSLRTATPEPRIDRIMNFWAAKQVSYCTIGKKAVRDNAQLCMGLLNFDLPYAARVIEECAAHQYADGHAVLLWYPYLEKNVYSDPSFWLIAGVCEYLKESGEFGFLDKKISYLDGGEDTVYGHLKQAAEWYLRPDGLGPHGLPLICHADWNDALNIPDERAESVLTAMFVLYGFGELAELAERLGDLPFAARLKKAKKDLTETVNRTAFNGDYYVRAFSKFGTVGDKGQPGGAIYVNPQAWAILAGIVPKDRLPKVLAAMDGMETEEGVPLCAPPYPVYDERVGRMSGMLPGVYENGGIYNHAGCFKVMADCELGRGDRALATLLKIIPDGPRNPSSRTTCEPYVFTNCYLKHPAVDMMVGSAWQTGTSAWGLRCFYEGILGLRRSYEGLRIRPCLPSSWREVQARRVFRGDRLNIRYRRGDRVERPTLTADGKVLEGDLLPVFGDGREHEILVELPETD